MNVFVYHTEDREGNFLADMVHRLDQQQSFQFLPVGTAQSLDRLDRFLQRQNLTRAVVSLPFVVVVRDLSGMVVETHQIIYGKALEQWLESVVQRQVLQQPQAYLQACRQSLLNYLSTTTLRLATLCLCPSTEPAEAPVVAAPAPPPASFVATKTTPEPRATRHRSIRSGNSAPDAGSSEVVVVTSPQEGMDAWTDASVPEPRSSRSD